MTSSIPNFPCSLSILPTQPNGRSQAEKKTQILRLNMLYAIHSFRWRLGSPEDSALQVVPEEQWSTGLAREGVIYFCIDNELDFLLYFCNSLPRLNLCVCSLHQHPQNHSRCPSEGLEMMVKCGWACFTPPAKAWAWKVYSGLLRNAVLNAVSKSWPLLRSFSW